MTTKATNRTMHRQRGLTLIEIMIALGISIILMTGLLQVFISSKQSYRLTEASARLQENGRFAVSFLTDDLRMAGYTGCYRGLPSNVESILNNPTAYNWDFSKALDGNEATGGGWSPALDASIAGLVLPDTDVVIMRGLSNDGISLVAPYSDSGQLFVDPAADNVQDGDILMVTDCLNASMFQATNQQVVGGRVNLVHSNAGGWVPGNTGPLLSNSFGADAQLARFVTNIFYIGTGASGEPALFRRSLGNSGVMTDQELVEGVENMQVVYGEDTDNDKVSSVRISLLLRTDDAIASAAQTYTYNGANVAAADLRIRRVFTTTIKLRNRGQT
jgi:type IV pilus assembly protein PilW